ncbi:hypothetical protein P43SY_001721 [Pythium insidiosum]|uniref:ABC transporter domain-containing protein n=1 Tax=Pythium insidiosum TaxID=114742 RepID=A0AAD5Q7F6_PYTIN|nr:hypothetical protein P43SY_001721 [Pythium insidiosum]
MEASKQTPRSASPQVEVRFHDLSVSVDHIVTSNETHDLPTLPGVVHRAFRALTRKKSVVSTCILQPMSGVLRPGTMTLVLGQPGAGKSTFLKALSGRISSSKAVSAQGDVTLNGTSINQLHGRLPQLVSLVSQHDTHFPTLSVEETIDFARECAGLHPSDTLMDKTPLRHPATDDVISQLGLTHCRATRIGDAMTRGVSGGERKRVTIGEMAFGDKAVLLLDEITTGLDSSAALDIVATYRQLATTYQKTVVISLLQPAPEVYELFDDVILLNRGFVMYYGPRNHILSYFQDIGLDCPPNRDAADFLLDLGKRQQLQYEVLNRSKSLTPPHPANPKKNIDLLKGISGFALPGTITALMGSSGAGKTTLMDVIAGRKTGGKIRGQILLNGHEATALAIQRATGYCEQMDIHSEASTIREALTFSAFLRQGSDVPDSQKYDSVDECLELLDLHPIADQIIRGSSVEQMKRLTIGVELAAQPSVLFLDEPTSGLDARSAKMIMDGVRKVADTGRTVVCTIHQPSSEVFMVFDSLLLLKRGGETVFFGELGENASQLIQYFESVPGVTPIEDGYNPATWMLEVIAASELLQASMVLRRFVRMYWRTPSYNLTRFVVSAMLALIFGLLFSDVNYGVFQGMNSGVGMVLTAMLFLGLVAVNSVLPISSTDRAAFYRERASQTYNAFWYFVGGTIIEVPYVFVSTLIFTSIFFPMVGFSGGDRFVMFWLNLALQVLLQTYLGQLLVYSLPSIEVAAVIGSLVNSTFLLFMGGNPPAAAIPSGYKWLYHCTPQKYTLAALIATVFADCSSPENATDLACQRIENLPPSMPAGLTVKQFVEQIFLMKYDEISQSMLVVLGLIIFVRVLGLLALRFINHQKR